MIISLNSLSKPSPKWLKNLSNISIIILGALAGWSLTIPDSWISLDIKNFIGSTLTMLVSILKGLEMFSSSASQSND